MFFKPIGRECGHFFRLIILGNGSLYFLDLLIERGVETMGVLLDRLIFFKVRLDGFVSVVGVEKVGVLNGN